MKMNDYIDLVNTTIDELMPVHYPHKIFKSMKYTVTLPGKRLRPVMCLETAECSEEIMRMHFQQLVL